LPPLVKRPYPPCQLWRPLPILPITQCVLLLFSPPTTMMAVYSFQLSLTSTVDKVPPSGCPLFLQSVFPVQESRTVRGRFSLTFPHLRIGALTLFLCEPLGVPIGHDPASTQHRMRSFCRRHQPQTLILILAQRHRADFSNSISPFRR